MRTYYENWLYSENPLGIDDNTKNIILDNLPIKYRTDKYLNAVIVIVHRLSNLPWYTQEEVLSEINLNKDELIKLNKVITFVALILHIGFNSICKVSKYSMENLPLL